MRAAASSLLPSDIYTKGNSTYNRALPMSAPQSQFTGPQPSATAIFYRNIRWLRFVDRFGRKGQAAMEYLGGLAELAGQTITASLSRPFYSSEVLTQFDEVGVKSLS